MFPIFSLSLVLIAGKGIITKCTKNRSAIHCIFYLNKKTNDGSPYVRTINYYASFHIKW